MVKYVHKTSNSIEISAVFQLEYSTYFASGFNGRVVDERVFCQYFEYVNYG